VIRYIVVDYRLIDHAVYDHGIKGRQDARAAMLPETRRCPRCGWTVR
jgi:hypothetical protein